MANKFNQKKWELEELSEIYEWLTRRIETHSEKFMQLDEMEQKTTWNDETRHFEPVWEDEEQTVPVMIHKWGTVTVGDDELEEDVLVRRRVCEKLKEYIDKQI